MRWGWTEQIVRMPLKAVPGAAVAKALLSAREVIILPQPKPTSFKWPGGTASGRQTAWGVDSEVQRLRSATLCFLFGHDKEQHFHQKATKSANLARENFTTLPRNVVFPQHHEVYLHL